MEKDCYCCRAWCPRSATNVVQPNAKKTGFNILRDCICFVKNTTLTSTILHKNLAFWFRGFFWVLLEALGIFWGIDFYPQSHIPVTLCPEYPLEQKSIRTSKYGMSAM